MNLCKNLLLSRWQFPGPGWECWTVIKDSVMDNILTGLLQMISDYSSLFVPSQFASDDFWLQLSLCSFPVFSSQACSFPLCFPLFFWLFNCQISSLSVFCPVMQPLFTQGQPWDPKERQMLDSHLGGTTSIPKGKGSHWLSRLRDGSLALYLCTRAAGSWLLSLSVEPTREALQYTLADSLLQKLC